MLPSPSEAAAANVTALSGSDPDLEADLAAGLERLQGMLPIVVGPVTLDRAERDGVEIVVYGRIASDVSEAGWVELQEMLPGQQCRTMGPLIERGARMTYWMTDGEREQRALRVTSCPESET